MSCNIDKLVLFIPHKGEAMDKPLGKFDLNQMIIKGIVSRDWRGLQMILLHRSEVFIISASCFFYFVAVFIQYF